MTASDILSWFPIRYPYKYIDGISALDEYGITGFYRFKEEEFFYRGHFPGYPVTPGAILLESSVQIGLLAYGMFLLSNGFINLTPMPSEIVDMYKSLLSDSKTPDLPEQMKLPSGIDPEILHYRFFLVSSDIHFKSIVMPGETVLIRSEKVFFKMNKLKCNVTIESGSGRLAGKGVISGFVIDTRLWTTGS